VEDTAVDYSRYFWQSDKVRLHPLRAEDAEQSFIIFPEASQLPGRLLAGKCDIICP
jgi:hypothetical protein